MSKICHRHCPDEGADIGLLAVAGAAVAAGLAVVAFVIGHIVVLAIGLAAAVVVTVAWIRLLLKRSTLVYDWRLARQRPVARAVTARPAQAITAPQRLAIEAPAGSQVGPVDVPSGVTDTEDRRITAASDDAAGGLGVPCISHARERA